jgi:YHS domain-containing protein
LNLSAVAPRDGLRTKTMTTHLMKTRHPLLTAALFAGLNFSATVRADEKPAGPGGPAAVAQTEKAKPYPLDFCLVSDEKFATSDMKPFVMVHEGRTIKFCCKNCVKDFKQDPKKYLTKLADEVKKQEQAAKKKAGK